MKLRPLLKKALKPLVMAGIAATVALSLIVTTPSNAQAFVPPPVLPVVFGATEMAIPELMATSTVLGPVGWGLAGVAVVGIGLYATRDYWVPYITGLFGQPDPKQPNAGGTSYAKYDPDLSWPACGPGGCIFTSTVSGYNKINATVQNTSAVTKNYAVLGAVRCKKADGTTYTRSGTSSGGIAAGGTAPAAISCANVGDTILTGKFGASCSFTFQDINPCTAPSSLPGPAGVLIYGDPDGQAFNPKSPLVKYRAEAECLAADGTKSMANAYSTGDMAGIVFPSCDLQGKGHGTGKITVWATPPNSTQEQNIWSVSPPTASPDRPLCSPQRVGAGCKLAVQLDGQPCVVGVFECLNWTDLSKDTNFSTRFSCLYGPYVVPLTTCNPLEKAYRPGGAPATTENTDGDPSTSNDAQPDGVKVPVVAPPITSTVPGGAGSPVPSPAPSGTPDAQSQDCFPNGWAVFNPVEWVMKPVGCALKFAFVPSDTVMHTQTSRLKQKLNDAGPVKVITAWQNTFNAVGGGSGCAGPSVNFSMEGYTQTMQPFNACSGGMATAASISFAVSSVVIVLFGGLGIARAVASAFGFNFTFGKAAST